MWIDIIEKAIEECINCNVLKDFLLERKAEAMHTLLTEYAEEDVSKIKKNYDIAKEFAPDYNVEKIMAKLG